MGLLLYSQIPKLFLALQGGTTVFVREGFKKNVDLSTFASDPTTHPQNVEKNVVFFGFLAHL